MSLLEDVFLENEAGEALELERVIEGDEYDTVPRAVSPNSENNSEKEDEAEEDKRHVNPSDGKQKRVIKNPRFILNPARLTGPRGIQVIPEHFKNTKFKGKGREREDLDLVLKKLEHWAYRLYPKFGFDDCLKKIETLGKKRQVMVHLQKIRNDQLSTEDIVVQKDSSDEETATPQVEEFDILLQQQIAIARGTPAPSTVKKPVFSTPRVESIMPKATSSPSISDEQKERMLRNRRLAEERRLARLKQNNNGISNTIVDSTTETVVQVKKHNESNMIESSDEETQVNVSITVDVHENMARDTEKIEKVNEKSNENNKLSIDGSEMEFSEESVPKKDDAEAAITEISESSNVSDGDMEKSENNNVEEIISTDVNVDIQIEKNNKSMEKENKLTTNSKCTNEMANELDNCDQELNETMDVDFSEEF